MKTDSTGSNAWRSRTVAVACWLMRGLTVGLLFATAVIWWYGAFLSALFVLAAAVIAALWSDKLTARQQ